MAGKPSKRLRITLTDGRTYDVKFTPKAQVQAERHFGRSLLTSDKIEEAYYMGFISLQVAGLYHGGFEDFLNELEDVDKPDDEKPKQPGEEPDTSEVPTGQAQSPAISSD